MLNNKQKQSLVKYAQEHKIIKFNIGKGHIDEKVIENLSNGIRTHELIKISLLKTAFNSQQEKNEIFIQILMALKADLVSKIGNTIVVYKENKDLKNPINLSKI